MKKLIFTMTVAACFAAAQAQTNEKRGSINLWGYVVDSFLQTGLEGAKVTLMTADSTVVDSIRTYPYDGNALFHFLLSDMRPLRLRWRLFESSITCFFNSISKYLQKSSNIQKISTKFAVSIGVVN